MSMRLMVNRGQREAARRSQERRQREDSAARLHDVVPRLSGLALELRELRDDEVVVKYVRHLVLERAPALFEIPCTDPSCREGGHDVTAPVLRALRGTLAHFEGEHGCSGQVGRGECRRVLRYEGLASFSA